MSPDGDRAFIAAFEAGRPLGGSFRHVDHVRLAWIVLRQDGVECGEERIAAGIRRFAAQRGVPGLYHDTLTRAWVRLVAAALAADATPATFAAFLAAHPQLSDKAFVFRFFSAAVLSTAAARQAWVDPDLAPLPPHRFRRRRERRAPLLRAAFALGALTDALAVVPLLMPSMASLLWGFDMHDGPHRFAMGYAASLMVAWTILLMWAYRRPLERAFVAPLTVLVIYGLIATEVVAVCAGDLSALRVLPTWILQGGLLALFAAAYHHRTWVTRSAAEDAGAPA
jgi:hypothetical protein